ncbi:MAG: SPOR domain-containing protein [Sulfuricella sp.]|nr:SPOR domain-containing protein [Sulfuricella sp.]
MAFVLLLAANLVALALFQFPGGRSGGAESTAGHVPFQAEKVKVVAAGVTSTPRSEVAEKLPESAVEPAPLPAPAPAKSSPPPMAPAKPVAALQCLEWINIADADLEQARKALQKLKLADQASFRKMEKTSGYWVYIPPRKTLADAQKKVNELKALGVADIFILQENTAWHYAISLGVFSTEEAAAKYLVQLREKGVKSAISGPRNRAAENHLAALKNLDSSAATEVAKLPKEFADSEIRSVACR